MLLRKIALALAAPLMLTACIFSPGKFTSGMTVAADGRFTFRYAGEIVFISAYDLDRPTNIDFEYKCYGSDPGPDGERGTDDDPANAGESDFSKERPCNAAEKANNDKLKKESEERQKREREQAAKIFGFDSSDKRTVDDFVAQMRKQAGWKKVSHRGKGIFDVEYELSGTLDRDFVFPVFPKAQIVFPMVLARRRADGSVQVSAPAFGGLGGQGFGLQAMTGMAAMSAARQDAGNPSFPTPDGTFTVTTAAEVLTNNTEDGPSTGPGGQRVLTWKIGPQTTTGPETLLRLR